MQMVPFGRRRGSFPMVILSSLKLSGLTMAPIISTLEDLREERDFAPANSAAQLHVCSLLITAGMAISLSLSFLTHPQETSCG